MITAVGPTLDFVLPEELSATEPPEERGLERDEVRLLVAGAGKVRHAQFRDLPGFLRPGDLVVVNTSATVPAAVDGWWLDRQPVAVHVAGPHPDGVASVVELRAHGGPVLHAATGDVVHLPGGVLLRLLGPHPEGSRRLWRAELLVEGEVPDYLARVGRPVTYGYVAGRWPLSAYQTVFALEPGSVEMPSAGRPFTAELVRDLVVRGIRIAPVLLHTGLSSPEAHEPPQAERFAVPDPTLRLVERTRVQGGRVIAVGTTVVRALETAALGARAGWTDLVLGPDRPARQVDGLITGWHAPDASHLLLLEAVVGRDVLRAAYDEALREGYLWHEFGDSALLLPGRSS